PGDLREVLGGVVEQGEPDGGDEREVEGRQQEHGHGDEGESDAVAWRGPYRGYLAVERLEDLLHDELLGGDDGVPQGGPGWLRGRRLRDRHIDGRLTVRTLAATAGVLVLDSEGGVAGRTRQGDGHAAVLTCLGASAPCASRRLFPGCGSNNSATVT